MKKHGENVGVHAYILLSQEEKLRRNLSGNTIVDSVDAILFRAIELGISDIHLQPDELGLRIRFRRDGVLYDHDRLSLENMVQVLSRIKILSSLDIAQKRVPQDGTFSVKVDALQDTTGPYSVIDLRISTFPCTYGEKMVIRLLHRAKNMISIESLGMSNEMLAEIKRIIHLSHGLFLVTGPTGSGKTTSLYAMLSQLNHNQKNIVTMEDPVEFDVPGITQTQINTKLGFTFEHGLRSMLRQDPDVIMVGEIRDTETLRMAIESSLTGHLVLSTLHTNHALGAIMRLLDMGVEPFLINASLVAVLAQRLVKKLCNHCKKKIEPSADEIASLAKYHFSLAMLWKAVGCKHCFFTGYAGRVGIFELLVLDDDLRYLITHNPSMHEFEKKLASKGFNSMLAQGLILVKNGAIALEELLAVLAL